MKVYFQLWNLYISVLDMILKHITPWHIVALLLTAIKNITVCMCHVSFYVSGVLLNNIGPINICYVHEWLKKRLNR